MIKAQCPECKKLTEFYPGDLFTSGDEATLDCEHCENQMTVTRHVEVSFEVY